MGRSASSTRCTAWLIWWRTISARSRSRVSRLPTPTPPQSAPSTPATGDPTCTSTSTEVSNSSGRPMHSGRTSGRTSTDSGATGRPLRPMRPRSRTRSSSLARSSAASSSTNTPSPMPIAHAGRSWRIRSTWASRIGRPTFATTASRLRSTPGTTRIAGQRWAGSPPCWRSSRVRGTPRCTRCGRDQT